MIDNVFELTNLERSGVLDVTVDGVSVVHSGNVAEVPAIPEYDSTKHALTVGTRAEGSTVGNYSVAEGLSTEASETGCHAEGCGTLASGPQSHSEGYETVASGGSSHAEGQHTIASGGYSHAEGQSTIASAIGSHAEGRHTQANHKSQHVFGEYNIADDSEASFIERGNYVEIVGNGDSDTPSNARTLDWDGNEWLAGGLTIGDDNLEVPTILNGTTEPTSTDGRENSLYVKYSVETETIVPTTNPSLGVMNYLDVDFTQYEKVRIVIDTSIDPNYPNYHFDGIVNVNTQSGYIELADYDEQLEEHVILGQIDFGQSTYYIGSRIGSTSVGISQTLTIYNVPTPSNIDDIYFKKDDVWITQKKYIVVEGSFDNVGAEETASDSFSPQDLEALGFDISDILKYQCVSMARGINTDGTSDITQWSYQGIIFENTIFPSCYINSDNGIIEMRITCVNHNSSGTAKLFYRAIFMKVED